MVGWGSLLRRLARILAPMLLRHLRRRVGADRRRGGPAGDDADAPGAVIDVEAVGAFDRFDDGARRAVVRAAEIAGGADFTADALLLGLVETWPPLAEAVDGRETGAAEPRASLDAESSARSGRGPGPEARRALEQARAHADQRGRFTVGRRELLAGLLSPSVGLTSRLDAATLDALGRI